MIGCHRKRVDQILEQFKGRNLTPKLMEQMRVAIFELSRSFFEEGVTVTDERGEQISSIDDLVVSVLPDGPGRIKISARHRDRSYG